MNTINYIRLQNTNISLFAQDVNDNAPVFTGVDYHGNVTENRGPGKDLKVFSYSKQYKEDDLQISSTLSLKSSSFHVHFNIITTIINGSIVSGGGGCS